LADKIGRQKILIAQVFMAGLCYFAMAFTHTTLQMSLLWLATGFTWVCLMILTNIIMPEMII
jgi:MFS family permease